jgi:putative ABC transport system permease protein
MRWWRRGPNREADLDRELRSHLELEAQERQEQGASLSEAPWAAKRALGNWTRTKEATREMWKYASLERFIQDLRYGARLFMRGPGFGIVAVLTLALGIGANTAIFSVVNAVLLKPLPYREPDRLVHIWEGKVGEGALKNVVEPFNFLDWRERNHSFEQMAAINGGVALNVTGIGEPEALPGMMVTAEFFDILGVPPLIGREFLPEEGSPGHEGAVVLSYSYWHRHFGGDPGALGRKLVVNRAPCVVVGVMPQGFSFLGAKAELWTPLPIARTKFWQGGRFLTVMARLKRGITIAKAQEDMTGIARQLEQERPFTNKNWTAEIFPLAEDATERVRLPLLVLLGAVGFVLLIACANVANLLLMRSTGRLHEIGVRVALGAGRGRVLQQLLSENLLLSLAGWAAGLGIGYWGLKGLLVLLPNNIPLPRAESIQLDSRVFLFTLAAAILTTLLFGLAPALHVSRLELSNSLKQGSLRTGTGGNRIFRRLFVVMEMAMALLLLSGAGLAMRSFSKLIGVHTGFDPKRVLTMQVSMPFSTFQTAAQYMERMLDEVRGVPGVESAGSIHFLPLTERVSGSCFTREAKLAANLSAMPSADFLVISRDYFRTMGTPLAAGRDFSARDQFEKPSVAIVNQSFAQQYFPGEDPVGRRINVCWTIPNPVEIVGVVADARQKELRVAPRPTIFVANAQAPRFFAQLVIRSKSEPRQLARAVEAAIHRVNPDQPVSGVSTMTEVLSSSVAEPRFQLGLLLVFAAIAVLLAAIGVYGVVSYSVNQRTQEIGIRVALGARAGNVANLVLREGMLLAGIGVVLGLAGALALTRVLRSLLFEVTPTDPMTLFTVSSLLLIVSGVAMAVPARRAMSVDPMVALRHE